jgi:hypothetical protein
MSNPFNDPASKVIRREVWKILFSDASPEQKEQRLIELGNACADPVAGKAIIVAEIASLMRQMEKRKPDL